MNCTLNIEDYMNRITTSIDNLEYNINDNKIYYKSGITDDYMTKKDWLDKVKEHMNNHFAKKIPKLGYSDDVFKVITETIDNKFIPYIEYSPNNNSKKIIEEYVNDFYKPKIDKTESDVKKEIRLYNEVNESNIPLILSRLKKYNQSLGTKHRIEFKQIGETQRYKSNLILNFNNIEDIKKEKEKEKRVEEAREVQREDAKRADVEYDDNYLKDLEDRIIFTEKDRQIRMNFANLTDLIKNNDIRIVKLKNKDNKISDIVDDKIESLKSSSDIITDIEREKALEEFDKWKNGDINSLFYVVSYFTQVFADRIVRKDSPLSYKFQLPREGGMSNLGTLKNTRVIITKDNLKINPFYQYNNAIVVGIEQLKDYLTIANYNFEQFETIIRTAADEELIHLYADAITTTEDVEKIYDELSEKTIQEIKNIYGSDSLSKHGVVHEYLRMVIQNKLFGTTTEIEILKVSETAMDVLIRLVKRIIAFLTSNQYGNFTQTIINDIYNFTKGNISEELASKIENKVYKGVVVEANINRVKEGVAELFESNPELANEVYSKILTNSGISAENLLSLLEKENIVEKDCSGGKLKAKDGIRGKFTKGSKWEIVKDLKGYPSHAQGGVDIKLDKNGFSFTRNNGVIEAKHGLVLPNWDKKNNFKYKRPTTVQDNAYIAPRRFIPVDLEQMKREQLEQMKREQPVFKADTRTDQERKRAQEYTESVLNPSISTQIDEALQKPLRWIADPVKVVGDLVSSVAPNSPLAKDLPNTNEETFEYRKKQLNPYISNKEKINNTFNEAIPLTNWALLNTLPVEAAAGNMIKSGKNLIKPVSKAVGKTDDVIKSTVYNEGENKILDFFTPKNTKKASSEFTFENIPDRKFNTLDDFKTKYKSNYQVTTDKRTFKGEPLDATKTGKEESNYFTRNVDDKIEKHYNNEITLQKFKDYGGDEKSFQTLIDNINTPSKTVQGSLNHANGLLTDEGVSLAVHNKYLDPNETMQILFHEKGHQSKIVASTKEESLLPNLWEDISKLSGYSKYTSADKGSIGMYMSHPSEIYSRIMELKYKANLKPYENFTKELLEKIGGVERDASGKITRMSGLMPSSYSKNEELWLKLINKAPVLIPTIGSGMYFQSQNQNKTN